MSSDTIISGFKKVGVVEENEARTPKDAENVTASNDSEALTHMDASTFDCTEIVNALVQLANGELDTVDSDQELNEFEEESADDEDEDGDDSDVMPRRVGSRKLVVISLS